MSTLFLCRHCLASTRPLRSVPIPSNQTATFSTTTFRNARKGAPESGGDKRSRVQLNKSKKRDPHAKTYKIPLPGERKAIRKRVVLSNTNALAVPGLANLSSQHVSESEARKLQGSVIGFSDDVVDQLRASEAFKPTQGWGFFRRPASLIRRETAEVASWIESVDEAAPEEKKTVRRLIGGDKWSGKSVLMLQAQAMAFLKGWVVIAFPEAIDLTNGTTAYAPLPNTNPPLYTQKDYTAALLARTAKANNKVLSSLTISLPHESAPTPLQEGKTTLLALVQSGANDPEISQQIFEILWEELTLAPSSSPKQQRPPLLLALDGIVHISHHTTYLTPNMTHIHAHDFYLPQLFLSYLSGAKALPNGGMVLAEHSASNRPAFEVPAVDLAIKQLEGMFYPSTSSSSSSPPAAADTKETQQHLENLPSHDPTAPHAKIDVRALTPLQRTPLLKLTTLSKDEARSILEYYAQSGVLRRAVDEKLVAERWMIGAGVVGEIERGVVRGV